MPFDGIPTAIAPNTPTVSVAAENTPPTVAKIKRFPATLPMDLGIVLDDRTGKAFSVMPDRKNPYALPVGGRTLNNTIRDIALEEGEKKFTKHMLAETNETLQAFAERSGKVVQIFSRIAPIDGGVEIDLGDEQHTRVRIAGGNVEIVASGSDTLFYRPLVSEFFKLVVA